MAGLDVINDVKITNCNSNDTFEVEYRGITILCTLSGAVRFMASSLRVGSIVDVEVSSVNYTRGKIVAIK